MMKIYLVRHGRQESPLCNVNVGLAPEGVRQAELVAWRFRESIPVDAVYSSSLIRAVQTAEVIGGVLDIIPKSGDAALDEIDFGELTGLTGQEIDERYGGLMERRRNLEADLTFPGGECGAQVFSRALPCLRNIAESGAEHAVVVTHGGTIRAVIAGVLGLDQKYRLAIARTLENSGITVLEYNRKRGRFTVETVNDYAHLSGHPELYRDAAAK